MNLLSRTTLFALALLFAGWLPPLPAQESEHQLAPGDAIEVKVYQEDDLSSPKLVVSKDGKITLNLIGEVAVSGQTCTEAARAIEAKYRDGYLVKPSVTVAIVSYVQKFFTIGGEVNKPNRYVLPHGERLTIQQAIIAAGGFTRFAKESKAFVRRSGKNEEIEVNLKEKGSEPFYVEPNDTITIKKGL